ncbi:MAG: molybdenum cofactor biosynthesis protein MoaE [Candidatus Binatus sp.]|uniref:molybdenum cofactor biosynthesis protein n=1 Tax=Candidatus Binatus sp. TaxID=2811406 RepID=UPI002717DA8D|nr:molybdenum cofactor biosynthesis protein MoaE [Candidatus Binatus sp.]MDO8431710.1 molybdenum cofactor biosynthesis protein MoaE [Candidatus Binatus sp.]
MNRLTLKLFATLRERARTSELTREFPAGTTIAQIWGHLGREFPELGGHHDSVGFAVNQEYVESDYQPREGDEIAFIPPVSGGADAAAKPGWIGKITIGRDTIDVTALEREVAAPNAGAIVTFAGTTRSDNAGRNVLRLEYEAYEPMALSEMRKLAREAGERWKIVRIAIAHRVGVVEIGETSVAIAVSAAHRGEAFDACRFAIDRLKEIVPIWKKEHFEGGEIWIGCQTSHPPHV